MTGSPERICGDRSFAKETFAPGHAPSDLVPGVTRRPTRYDDNTSYCLDKHVVLDKNEAEHYPH